MENSAMDDKIPVGDDEEEFSESFLCAVCLELLYKPIVLSCGHVSCFWCVDKSMSSFRESRCPICRHPYYHFPTICQMLHFLLLKMYPVAYKRREIQTLEEEKSTGVYSPQCDADACGSQVQSDHPGNLSSVVSLNPNSNPSPSIESAAHMDHKWDEGTMHSEHSSDKSPEVTGDLCVEGKNVPQKEHLGQPKISLADVMCIVCKQLLFHPVVLNCGHVYCEACIFNLADEMLRCQVCQSPHPKGFPKVCLQLDHFLEQQFPEEYTQRKDAVHLGQINVTPDAPSSCPSDAGKGEQIGSLSEPPSEVHIGVGCDFCGIRPIIGNRYKCQDCKEKIGFDLCNDCYNTGSKLPGRFNQQHTSEHKFEQVQSKIYRTANSAEPDFDLVQANFGDLMWRMGDELEGSSFESESLENSELRYEDPTSSDDGEDNQNDSAAN